MATGVLQNARIFKHFKHKKPILYKNEIKRNSSIPQSIDAVLLERNVTLELNQIYPRFVSCRTDMIGPPHPVSNLRPIVWYRTELESPLERKLRDFQETTQDWNQQFWETHNTNFLKEKKLYMEKYLPVGGEKQTLTADEMSTFYKDFLDKNWKNHVTYNFQWYKRNFTILIWSILVNIEKLFQRS